MPRLFIASIWFVLLPLSLSAEPSPDTPFQVPEGFRAQRFAGDDLAHDIWCLALGPDDGVWVGGPRYIRFLADRDGDGTADEAIPFTETVRRGSMGLLVDGRNILSVESDAVLRYRDDDGDRRADGEPEVLIEFSGKGGEHGPHGIRKGPDGWFYVVCGNNTGVDESHANLPGSPVTSPRQGCILRIAPDGSGSQIVADGFRNPYDIAFNDEGRLFTYDSDNERDHHLPWYAPARVFDVVFGQHHGWLNPGHRQSYNTPEYFSVDRLAETGRGSPTGVEWYGHEAFPERYRGGLFHACWTFGHIYFTPLIWEEDGRLFSERSYVSQRAEIFARSGPEGGFAPVDLAVDSRGCLWVACGGRNTAGSVYRIDPPDGPGGVRPLAPPSLPQHMLGRARPAREGQHPHTVRLFLDDPRNLHLVYRAFQEIHGGIQHLPEPRAIDAGYTFRALPTDLSRLLRATIEKEAGAEVLLQMDLQAEDDLTKDAEEFASHWAAAADAKRIEPWRWRNYRELARCLGCVGTEFAPVIENITSALREDTHPTDDIHYLCCLAQMPGPRTSIASWRIASAFLQVDTKLDARVGAHPSRNWPLRLAELFRVHADLDPRLGSELMWSHSSFGNSVHHARYVAAIDDPVLKREVTRKLYDRLRLSRAEWTAEFAGLVTETLPDLPVEHLREIWDEQEPVRPVLAAWMIPRFDPRTDRRRLFECLPLADAGAVASAAESLLTGGTADLTQWEAEQVLRAASRHSRSWTPGSPLAKLTGADSVKTFLRQAGKSFPESALIRQADGSLDFGSLEKRLAEVDWESGNPARGESVFIRSGCAACHRGQSRLGPDLKGVSSRFGRDDFFRHTFRPNLAISDLYRALEITTTDGRVIRGVPVYTSPDQTILETAPGKTVNFSRAEILSSGPVSVSPMPEGLLLGATDEDLSNLWAFIRTQ